MFHLNVATGRPGWDLDHVQRLCRDPQVRLPERRRATSTLRCAEVRGEAAAW